MKQVGIVIVTHNSEECVGACVDAAARTGAGIVVVDNASKDRTCEIVRQRPHVRLAPENRNTGFAAAANRGAALLHHELILLLNPDAVLQTPLDSLVKAFDDPEVGAAGGKLVSPNREPQRGFNVRRFPTPSVLCLEALGANRLWPGNPINRRYRYFDLHLDQRQDVDQPAGAFLMVRRDAWLELGGMDENFHPLWFEDVDFLKRLRKFGWRVRYEPAVVAVHEGAHSIRGLSDGSIQLFWYDSLLKYASKHFSPLSLRTVCVAVALGALLRMLAGALSRRSLHPFANYGRVLQAAACFFVRGRMRGARRLAAAVPTG